MFFLNNNKKINTSLQLYTKTPLMSFFLKASAKGQVQNSLLGRIYQGRGVCGGLGNLSVINKANKQAKYNQRH